jgi:hypothetical protein
VHYNLLDTKRLRNKLVNDNGLYGEYGETNNINITDEEVLKKFIGQADIGEVPKEVIW